MSKCSCGALLGQSHTPGCELWPRAQMSSGMDPARSNFQVCPYSHDHIRGDPSYDDCVTAYRDELARVTQRALDRTSEPVTHRIVGPTELLQRALPMLSRLGDFIGNGEIDPQRPGSLGERCDLILDIKDHLERNQHHA